MTNSESTLYQTTAANAKDDLENLLTKSEDVQSATVTINGFEEASSSRKRRQATSSKATVNYSAECTVPESKSTDDISSSVETAVQNADPDNFSSFDSSSFADFSVDVEETIEVTTTYSETSTQKPDETTVFDTTQATKAAPTTVAQSTAGLTTREPSVETTTPGVPLETTTEEPSVETTTPGAPFETTTREPSFQTTTSGAAFETTTEEPSIDTTTVHAPFETTTGAPSVETTTPSAPLKTTREPSIETTTPDAPFETTTRAPSFETTTPGAPFKTTTSNQPSPTRRPTEQATTEGNDAITNAQEISADEAEALGELSDLAGAFGAL